jgi:CpeT/CpcT family (DUF1001).
MLMNSFLTILVACWITSDANGFLATFRRTKYRQLRGRTPLSSIRMETFLNVEHTAGFDVQLGDNLFPTLVSRFQGDFDNYHQVVKDRKMGLIPRQGGGHEHFHVTLIPMPIDVLPNDIFPVEKQNDRCAAVVASYYFDGMPNKIFRLRMYILHCGGGDEQNDSSSQFDKEQGQTVQMRLYTFCPTLEKTLRQNSDDALNNWYTIISDHVLDHGCESFTELNRCDIQWTANPDKVRHAYLSEFSTTASSKGKKSVPIHAKMIHDHEQGGVLLESQMMPGTFIRIQDELSLWEDELWINDRGFDADTKNMVYGNWKGVPYQMMRVASIGRGDEMNVPGQYRRTVVAPDLRWTLGEKWRTPQEYEMKMIAIGGMTSQMNSSR